MNRKTIHRILLPLSCLLLLCMAGCEFDAPTPAYYQNQAASAAPKITGMNPANSAPAGVNTITIQGENFSTVAGGNRVYFGSKEPEMVSQSATALVVYRPSITGKVTVKVTTPEAIEIAALENYTIDPVVAAHTGFTENSQMITFSIDKNGNIYACLWTTTDVVKVTPDGVKTTVGTLKRTVTDAKIAPDGQLATFANNMTITKMDPATGVETDWVKMSKKVSYGDFDEYGTLYTAGNKSDLFTVQTNLTKTASAMYAQSNVKDIRVFGKYVYVYSERSAEPARAVWKHEIKDAAGALGAAELVLDWATTGKYAQSTIKDFALSNNGVLYVATDNANPILMVYPDQKQEALYQGLIPSTAEHIVWGSGNSFYTLQGGTAFSIRIVDAGVAGAPYYSR
jgi:hypothetical protein